MNASTERLRKELKDLRSGGQKPAHWLYRIYQPVLEGPVGAVWRDAYALVEPPRWGRELLHPQDHPTMCPYYDARLPDDHTMPTPKETRCLASAVSR